MSVTSSSNPEVFRRSVMVFLAFVTMTARLMTVLVWHVSGWPWLCMILSVFLLLVGAYTPGTVTRVMVALGVGLSIFGVLTAIPDSGIIFLTFFVISIVFISVLAVSYWKSS